MGLGPWEPWLWSRRATEDAEAGTEGASGAAGAWAELFEPLDSPAGTLPAADPGRPRLPSEPGWARNMLGIALCTQFVFRPSARMREILDGYARSCGWNDLEPALGIHVRRGDAASEDISRNTRPSYPLETYLEAADRMRALYGYRKIYLSTESEGEIERARQLRPEFEIISLVHDRGVFPKIADTSEFIEHRALRDRSIVEPIANSTIADLHFLGRCRAFVGTFNSEFSMLALMLCIGNNGALVPYINLVRRHDMAHIDGKLEYRQ